ncbi:MAG TPA: hypothetical protein VFQ38_19590 [Longimicrobiales bacterium]|nr:hypothetical protein [Longimicrobiales bacterium]
MAVLGITGAAGAQNIRVGGVVYSEYEYLLADTAHGRNAFNVTRAYLNVVGEFSHGISTRVTADIYRGARGALDYRLKYAFFAWHPTTSSPVALKFGLIHTPWIDWEETLWGYRMQGTVAADRAGFLTSADLGAGVDLNWRNELVNGQAVIVNGEGFANPPNGKYLDAEARLSVRLLATDDASRVGGLRLSGYGHLGKFGDGGARDRAIGMLSYRSRLLTLAAEYGLARNGLALRDSAGVLVGTRDQDGHLFSAFGTLSVPGTPVGIIARVDAVDPDIEVRRDAFTRLIGGVSYRLAPNVRLLADLEHTDFQGPPPTPAAAQTQTRALFQTEFTF